MTRLSELESQAKTSGKGKWNKEKNPNVSVTMCIFVCKHLCHVVYASIVHVNSCITFIVTFIFPKAVRNIVWNIDNLRNFVDKNHGKEFDG